MTYDFSQTKVTNVLQRRGQWYRWLPYLCLAIVASLWVVAVVSREAPAVDFYPLYFAAQQVLAGQSPYGAEATNALMLVWNAPFASAGVAYPLPLILLVVPFSLLPLPVAAFIWTSTGFALSYASTLLVRHKSKFAWLLPFAFWPLYQAVMLGQATAIWFGLSVLLVLAIRRDNRLLTAILIVLLVLKPQNGLIFALYGTYWLLRYHPKWMVLTGAFGGVMFIGTHAIQPNWIPEWMEQVNSYRSIVRPANVFVYSLIIPLALRRCAMPWWAMVATFQVILFPITDLYSTVPFLLVWCALPLPVALIGTSVSWLPSLLGLPPSLLIYLLTLLLPLCLAGLWEARPQEMREWFARRGRRAERVGMAR